MARKWAKADEDTLEAWDEWEQTTGAIANDPDEFIAWAMENKRFHLRPRDVVKLLRKQVTSVLRQASRLDNAGFTYRAKQSVMIFDEDTGAQRRMWFDTDRGGTTNLRQKAVRQRRDAIANDVYRAACDVEHMNKVFADDPQLTFFADFRDDVAEHRATELLERNGEKDEAA